MCQKPLFSGVVFWEFLAHSLDFQPKGVPNLRQSLPAAGIIGESESAWGEGGRVGQGRVGFRV